MSTSITVGCNRKYKRKGSPPPGFPPRRCQRMASPNRCPIRSTRASSDLSIWSTFQASFPGFQPDRIAAQAGGVCRNMGIPFSILVQDPSLASPTRTSSFPHSIAILAPSTAIPAHMHHVYRSSLR